MIICALDLLYMTNALSFVFHHFIPSMDQLSRDVSGIRYAIYAGSIVYNIGYGEHQPYLCLMPALTLNVPRLLSPTQHLVYLYVVAPTSDTLSASFTSVHSIHARHEHNIFRARGRQHR
jgi:hypothetical protein